MPENEQPVYRVTVTERDDVWAATVGEPVNCGIHAPSLTVVPAMVRDAIATREHLDPAGFALVWNTNPDLDKYLMHVDALTVARLARTVGEDIMDDPSALPG